MASSALGRIQVKPTPVVSPIGGTTNALKRLTIIVDIGLHGIGLIIADDDSSKQLMVKDLRKLPDNVSNPSEMAGVKIGDRLERINGEAPANLQEAFTMLKNSKRSATLTILRK
jgi:C-terminal processing protease CtpA/Prc